MTSKQQKESAAHGFIRLVLVRPFTDELKRRGVEFEDAVYTLGIAPDSLDDPTKYVHAETLYRLLNVLADVANDPHLGYHVGAKLDFALWPPFQKAVRVARTVGEFMTEFIAAVPSEANSVRHELSVSSSGACYRVHRLIETRSSPQQTEAFAVATFIKLFQSIAGAMWAPDEVLVRTHYAQALPTLVQGVRVAQKPPGGLALHFPTSWLYAPVDLRSAFVRTDKASAVDLDTDVSLISVFQASARTLLSDLNAGVEDVAASVGLTSKSLKAALKREGTSAAKEFRRLRLETAKTRLREGEGSISEIAGDLGYSDPAHFTRFFRTQTGDSPRAFRAKLRHKA